MEFPWLRWIGNGFCLFKQLVRAKNPSDIDFARVPSMSVIILSCSFCSRLSSRSSIVESIITLLDGTFPLSITFHWSLTCVIKSLSLSVSHWLEAFIDSRSLISSSLRTSSLPAFSIVDPSLRDSNMSPGWLELSSHVHLHSFSCQVQPNIRFEAFWLSVISFLSWTPSQASVLGNLLYQLPPLDIVWQTS